MAGMWICSKEKRSLVFKGFLEMCQCHCCDWLFPRVQQYHTELEKSHCDTQIFPLCPLHSAARLRSRHLSTQAANITTSPPPAARGWGEKHAHITYTYNTVLLYCCHLFKLFLTQSDQSKTNTDKRSESYPRESFSKNNTSRR